MSCACNRYAYASNATAASNTSRAIEQIAYTSSCPGSCLSVTSNGYRCGNSCSGTGQLRLLRLLRLLLPLALRLLQLRHGHGCWLHLLLRQLQQLFLLLFHGHNCCSCSSCNCGCGC